MKTGNINIDRITNSWKLRFGSLLVFVSLFSSLMIVFPGYILNFPGFEWLVVSFPVILIIFYSFTRRKIPTTNETVKILDHQIRDLEYSTGLLIQTPSNSLEVLQQQKIVSRLNQVKSEMKFPLPLKEGINISFISLIIASLLIFIQTFEREKPNLISTDIQKNNTPLVAENSDTLILKKFSIKITPPSYTGLKSFYSKNEQISAIENSTITWKAEFNREPAEYWLEFSDGKKITPNSNFKVTSSDFFFVNYTDHEGINFQSDLFKLEVIKDQPPKIVVSGIDQFTKISYTDVFNPKLQINVTDDFGITDAYFIATIAKGSGESIKFREQKISISDNIQGNTFRMNYELDVKSFQLEPGNELYFYLEALDNKSSEYQSSRTESFFYIIEDTANVEFSLQGNLGVDLMPEYFRSQLQIIIDSKKLLEERASISKQEFNKRSNELGFDQKQLRLKYGQFVGEEEDSGLEINNEEPDLPATDGKNVLSDYGHNHDHENEEGQNLDKGTYQHEGHDHDHDHGDDEDSGEEDPLEKFIHSHEDEETATFYNQSLKSKLKAALNEMWDAELYLRLFDPEQSLPYQYKALKLIKEIRNHARVYVKRIGFEPPSINEEEVRMEKNPEDVYKESFINSSKRNYNYPASKALLDTLSSISLKIGKKIFFKNQISEAGNEIASLEIDYPGKYFQLLNSLNQLRNSDTINAEHLPEILYIISALRKIPQDDLQTINTIDSKSTELGELFQNNLLEKIQDD